MRGIANLNVRELFMLHRERWVSWAVTVGDHTIMDHETLSDNREIKQKTNSLALKLYWVTPNCHGSSYVAASSKQRRCCFDLALHISSKTFPRSNLLRYSESDTNASTAIQDMYPSREISSELQTLHGIFG